MAEESLKDRLVRTGLEELNQHGVKNFSVRRVAAACGVSCAAPYKHFRNKDEFLAAVIDYANQLWEMQIKKVRQDAGSEGQVSTLRRQILEICRSYIRFLTDNPYVRSVKMMKDKGLETEYHKLKVSITKETQSLIERYRKMAGIPEHAAKMKMFVGWAIVYGATVMLDNGEMPDTPESLNEVIALIDREFDLPWEPENASV